MASLQDQLLKSGLASEKKAKQIEKEKRKQKKVQHKSKIQNVDETKQAVDDKLKAKAERDKELNKARDAELAKKAIKAQIKQLVDMNRRDRTGGDVAFNFKDGVKIKKIYVSQDQFRQLSNGLLAIVTLEDEVYELVPAAIAEKISEKNAQAVLCLNDDNSDDDDDYADYQIPDDLMW